MDNAIILVAMLSTAVVLVGLAVLVSMDIEDD